MSIYRKPVFLNIKREPSQNFPAEGRHYEMGSMFLLKEQILNNPQANLKFKKKKTTSHLADDRLSSKHF